MVCTTTMTHIDLALDDVADGVRFFRRVLALPVRHRGTEHAEVRLADDLIAHLRTSSPPTAPRRGPGPILELLVADVRAAVRELRRRGATVLVEPVRTEWGTESAFIAGPGDVVIEIYRPVG